MAHAVINGGFDVGHADIQHALAKPADFPAHVGRRVLSSADQIGRQPLRQALETFGGAALLLGLLTRWVALALALEMAVALVLVHLPAGFAATQGGVEFPLALLAGLVALACLGAPVWALDASLPALAPATGSEPAEPEAARRAA